MQRANINLGKTRKGQRIVQEKEKSVMFEQKGEADNTWSGVSVVLQEDNLDFSTLSGGGTRSSCLRSRLKREFLILYHLESLRRRVMLRETIGETS